MRPLIAVILSVAILMAQTYGKAPITIANGGSLSTAVNLGLGVPTSILMSGSWTTASLSFQCSADNSTFGDLYDDSGNEVIVSASASQFVYLPALYFSGCMYVKVRSGTSGSPVVQGADRVLVVILRR